MLLDHFKIGIVHHNIITRGNGFQLQGDVRHDADNGNYRHQAADQRTLAIPGGEKVSNGGDTVYLGNTDYFSQEKPP